METGYIQYFIHLANKIRHASEIKWMFATMLGFWSFFFDPAAQLAQVALFALILIDFVFGISASRKSGESVKSAKMVRTAIKMAVYFALIASARLAEHSIGVVTLLDETITGFLAATELISILENAGRLGYAVPQKIFDILGDFVKSKKQLNAERTRRLSKK